MACDATSVEALLVASDKYLQLSQRQGLEWLAQLVTSIASLTVDQAIDLAATNKMAALSDRQLEECRLAVFTAALYDAQTLVTEMAAQKYASLDRHDLMCAAIAAYCNGIAGSDSAVETLSVGDGYFKLSEQDGDLLGLDAVICAANSTHCTSIFALRVRTGITGMSERHLKEVICAAIFAAATPQVPGGFSIVQNADGTVTVTWDIPGGGVSYTEVWTSTDGITYVLQTTIPAPGNSTTIPNPGSGTDIYIKIRQCNAANVCGDFTTGDHACALIVGNYALDTMESYTTGVALDGLSGGTSWCTPSAYTDRSGYLGLLALDTMESYTTGTNLFGDNGGTGWNGAYGADNVSTALPANEWADGSVAITIVAAPAGGFPAYSYQWRKDGINLTNTGHYSGVTTSTLTITGFDVTDEATFDVLVTDTSGRSAFASTQCVTSLALTNGQLWAQQVFVNSGPWPSLATVNAADTFDSAVSGIRSKIYHLNFIANDSLIAALTPLYADFGFKLWTKSTVGGGAAESLTINGLKSASSDANGILYNTGIVPNLVTNWTAGNGGLGVYVGEATAADSGNALAGSYDGTTSTMQVRPYISTHSQAFVWNAATSIIDVAHTNLGGFYLASRTATNSLDLYFANSTHAWSSLQHNAVVNAVTPNPQTIRCNGGINNATTVSNASRTSFFVACDGLSSADGQTLYNAIQALRTTLGGGFI